MGMMKFDTTYSGYVDFRLYNLFKKCVMPSYIYSFNFYPTDFHIMPCFTILYILAKHAGKDDYRVGFFGFPSCLVLNGSDMGFV